MPEHQREEFIRARSRGNVMHSNRRDTLYTVIISTIIPCIFHSESRLSIRLYRLPLACLTSWRCQLEPRSLLVNFLIARSAAGETSASSCLQLAFLPLLCDAFPRRLTRST